MYLPIIFEVADYHVSHVARFRMMIVLYLSITR